MTHNNASFYGEVQSLSQGRLMIQEEERAG